MIRTLRFKFILVNMLLVAIVLTAVFSALCVTAYRSGQREIEVALQMALSQEGGAPPPRLEPGRRAEGGAGFALFSVFTLTVGHDGALSLNAPGGASMSEEDMAAIAQAAVASDKEAGTLGRYNLRFQVKPIPGGTKIALIDLSQVQASVRRMALMAVVFMAVSLGAFFVISLFLSRWALRPVERAWAQQRRFVADASHELKTPLTVILANTGILRQNRLETVESQMGWVDNTEAEAIRMRGLVDSLLFLAKSDDARAPRVLGHACLSEAVLSVALALESVAFERGITLDTEAVEGDIHISGDMAQLKQLAAILIDNGIKYAPAGAAVGVSLSGRQGKAILAVSNPGKGLSQAELTHIFDRFYRADQSRAQEGYGLGLSIAKSIVETHHGKITAQSGPDGTTFTVTLPLEPVKSR